MKKKKKVVKRAPVSKKKVTKKKVTKEKEVYLMNPGLSEVLIHLIKSGVLQLHNACIIYVDDAGDTTIIDTRCREKGEGTC